MIDYFYSNKGLAEGKFHVLHGKENSQKKWAELAIELNLHQGATKTAEQWQVWRDLKSRTSIKARDIRKAKGLTGNKAISKPELTEFEQRVIGIIGSEYGVLEELEHGNDAPLSEISKIISVCTNISQNISEDIEYLDALAYRW
ncbi:hypothetical protein PV328_004049 [Microctonus aethiopoides]|uniref:Regulatory protein zeste n=1 Tax=Microctonus aethiopoides TaxID=144406 RepID=A0AA39F9Q1_9HYME|nr:hypothetical protein PV328_004049 [Microctonus aethiopoides]